MQRRITSDQLCTSHTHTDTRAHTHTHKYKAMHTGVHTYIHTHTHLDRGKGSGVRLQGLALHLLEGVQLHEALSECGPALTWGVCVCARVCSRNSTQERHS